MSRVYNFSAGPAVLPEEVLKEAAAEMLDYKGSRPKEAFVYPCQASGGIGAFFYHRERYSRILP